jgi:hypothetical protein
LFKEKKRHRSYKITKNGMNSRPVAIDTNPVIWEFSFLLPTHILSLALFMKSANICLHTQAGAADWWPFYHFVAIGDIFVYDSIL